MSAPDRLTPTFLATAALLAWGTVRVDSASARVRETLRNDLPSRTDYDRMERGYYEQLIDAGRTPAPVPGALAGHGEPVALERGRLTDNVTDVREFVLKPNMTRDPGRRIPWSTNTHGMRDREHSVVKPPGTFRIGLAGDSIAAGWGVGDDEGLEPRLEVALDARSRASGGPGIEVLNFAVPGHGPGQRWTHFDAIGWRFDPDLVVFEATAADFGWDERRLRVLLAAGIGFDAPVYADALRSAGIGPGRSAEGYRRLMKPHRRAILAGVYRAVAAECKARGVACVWVLIPRVGKPVEPAERQDLCMLARDAGFNAVVDASDAYDGAEASALAVAPNDFHPNSAGHARLALALEPALADAIRADRRPTVEGAPQR